MKKILVSLTEVQLNWLGVRADRLGITRSELLRRIVDEVRIKETTQDHDRAERPQDR